LGSSPNTSSQLPSYRTAAIAIQPPITRSGNSLPPDSQRQDDPENQRQCDLALSRTSPLRPSASQHPPSFPRPRPARARGRWSLTAAGYQGLMNLPDAVLADLKKFAGLSVKIPGFAPNC